jgi:hypothetical protein
MSIERKVLGTSPSGGDALTVEDVFSTYLYTATGPSAGQTITNGIDLDGEGGLVWIKNRTDAGTYLVVVDTARGANKWIYTSSTAAQATSTSSVTSFNTNGFTLGTDNGSGDTNSVNYAYSSPTNMVSWTFRKAPRFFDVVTYTGNGTAGREIAHNLGCDVGWLVVKKLDSADHWTTWHRSLSGGGNAVIYLSRNWAVTSGASYWNNIAPTDAVFTLGTDNGTNINGGEYVAYLFAHDPEGENGDDGMIACGSYTGGTGRQTISLGWEPQYVMIKSVNNTSDWFITDSMRGVPTGGDTIALSPNLSSAENSDDFPNNRINYTADGFYLDSDGSYWDGSGDYIYMAIRAPMMKEPEAGTDVFAVDNGNGSDIPAWTSGFPVDMVFWSDTTGDNHKIASRLTGARVLETDTTGTEVAQGSHEFDYSDGFYSATRSSVQYAHMFKRAKGFFDVVAYTGDGTNPATISHGLGVEPELIIYKNRSAAQDWFVSWGHLGLKLNSNASHLFAGTPMTVGRWGIKAYASIYSGAWTTNTTGDNYIAYLFATLDGVSKVGSYTGNGTNQTIDCGFSTGARFILIKRTDSTGDWFTWDTERGIVAGNDPHLSLNTTAAEVTTDDSVDPDSSGFIVNQVAATNINVSAGEYIFYSIA